METQTRTSDWRISTLGAAIIQSRFRALQRPATPFELMDDAISYYRENFKPLFRISLWIYIVPLIVSILMVLPAILLSRTPESVAIFNILDFLLLLFFYLPYFVVAPLIHSAFTTLAFRMIPSGEPITLGTLWQQFKPRFWTLVLNQILATIAIVFIALALAFGYVIFFFATTFGVAAIAGSSAPTLSLVLLSSLLTVGTIVFLVLAAMALVWFIILPQVIVLEPNVDAILAFSRAFELVRANYKHAVLCCLAFWGLYAVLTLALTGLIVLVLGIVAGLIAVFSDPELLFTRWLTPLFQTFEAANYVAYMVLMPVMYLTSILLYFDLRYRYEGLDVYEALQKSRLG
ncbi:MAG: hypothetical protein RMK45_10570 [Armatimonadota bacterium]|nr:hypothetical protein [Armatimonadota bacterium]